jgi:CheY-like chemotaxis protein
MTDLPDLQGVKILVIEDDPDTAELTVTALRASGASVWAAGFADQARTLLSEVVPDVVICDLALPKEDGIAFARWLRGQPLERGGRAAVIAYTAYDGYFTKAVSSDSGFTAIVKKPADPGYVCRVVADVVRPPESPHR